MPTDQDDKLARLLKASGSIDEKTRLAKELDEETLQKAEPHSVYAKIEWERRASARRDARKGETLSIARRALASSEWANRIATIAIICSVITAIVVAIIV
jgi:hypothetical protein